MEDIENLDSIWQIYAEDPQITELQPKLETDISSLEIHLNKIISTHQHLITDANDITTLGWVICLRDVLNVCRQIRELKATRGNHDR
jgi:hypothetical protein